MSLAYVIIITLLAIIAVAVIIMALTANKAGARYDREMDRDYAKMRAEMDHQSEKASHADAR